MIALVALRVGIGWHFFQEGASKVHDPSFSSAAFLQGAKGPLAGTFQGLIPDPDGLGRLDLDATRDAWEQYRERLAQHYGLDEQQRQQAQEIWVQRDRQLRTYFERQEEEIEEYLQGLERRDRNRSERARMEVASLRGQAERFEREVAQQRSALLQPLDDLWAAYERDLNAVATDEQQQHRALALPRPGRSWLDAERLDTAIPYFDMAVGALLIVGLFTRVASIAGALFLGSVIASQWPGAVGAMPVYYQTIEMLALLVLAAVGAGRFAGLDFFLYALRMRCCPPKQGDPS